MDTNDYLKKVLSSQTFADHSDELEALQGHRAAVEGLLRDHFGDCSPTIRYGGSKVKGTMIRESYDLNIICYFRHDDTEGGETLEDIYNNVHEALKAKYLVVRRPRRSGSRIRARIALARTFTLTSFRGASQTTPSPTPSYISGGR